MPHWKHTLDIKDLHDRYEEDQITLDLMAGEIAKRLKTTPYADEGRMQDIIEQFESIASDGDEAGVEEYDAVLAELYDFGDDDHQLWIKTI